MSIVDRILDAITGRDPREQQQPDVRPASEDPYGDPADQGANAGYPGDVLPASQDPYGDPADVYNGEQVLPASQDPYGDPADQGYAQGGYGQAGYNPQDVRPASEDPYGDPADEEAARRRGGWPF